MFLCNNIQCCDKIVLGSRSDPENGQVWAVDRDPGPNLRLTGEPATDNHQPDRGLSNTIKVPH